MRQGTTIYGQKGGQLGWTTRHYWLTNEKILNPDLAVYTLESGHKQGRRPVV